MHWLSFLIGALVGWLIGWLIDYLICRPRRAAAEAELRAKLVEGANREVVALKGQLAGHKDLQVRLDGANGEINGLKAQLAGMKDVQANLDICRSQTKQYEFEIERLNVDLAAARAGVAGLGAAASLALPEKRNLEVGLEEPVTRAPEVIVPDGCPHPDAGCPG